MALNPPFESGAWHQNNAPDGRCQAHQCWQTAPNDPRLAPRDASAADPIARYEAYWRVDPNNPALLLALADLYDRAGRFDDALAISDEGLKIEPMHAVLRGHKASVLISLHRFAEAQGLLQYLIAQSPRDPALLHGLGLTQFHQQQYAAARDSLEAARKRGAKAAETFSHLAHAAHHLGDLAHARETALAWSQVQPSAAAEGYLSLVELDCGDFETAFRRAEASRIRRRTFTTSTPMS